MTTPVAPENTAPPVIDEHGWIKRYNLADCRLFRTPEPDLWKFQAQLEQTVLTAFVKGGNIDSAVQEILKDQSNGSVYQQIRGEVEDALRFQRAAAIDKIDREKEREKSTAYAAVQKSAATIAAEREDMIARQRAKLAETATKATSAKAETSVLSAQLKDFHTTVRAQLGNDEEARAALYAVAIVNNVLQAGEGTAASAEQILRSAVRPSVPVGTEYGKRALESFEYTPAGKYRDFVFAEQQRHDRMRPTFGKRFVRGLKDLFE